MEDMVYATITIGVFMNFGITKWFLFWVVAIPLSLLVGRHLFQAKREPNHKIISVSLLILIASCLFPLIEIQGVRTSVLTFVLNGSIPFLILLLGFITALILLLTKNPNADYPSGIAYLIGFIALWIGFWQILSGSVNDEVVFIYILLPIIIFIFYIALYFAPLPAGKTRTGIWKMIDEWGNKR